jgi:hypothetical protein
MKHRTQKRQDSRDRQNQRVFMVESAGKHWRHSASERWWEQVKSQVECCHAVGIPIPRSLRHLRPRPRPRAQVARIVCVYINGVEFTPAPFERLEVDGVEFKPAPFEQPEAPTPSEVECPVCGGWGPDVESCARCNGFGTIPQNPIGEEPVS